VIPHQAGQRADCRLHPGGAWRQRRSPSSPFLAELFVNAGANLAVARLRQHRTMSGATSWRWPSSARRHRMGLPERPTIRRRSKELYVCGHSSAGISPASSPPPIWAKDFGLPKDMLKGAILARDGYDLKPVRLSKRSKYVKFTDEIEQELSRSAISTVSLSGDPCLWHFRDAGIPAPGRDMASSQGRRKP